MNILATPVPPTRQVPLLFCDIDGTVRFGKAELGRFVECAADVECFPAAVDRIAKWCADGGRVVGVSNQIRVGLGLVAYEQMRAAMVETNRQCGEAFDLILACVQADDSKCWCQKPKGGLLSEAVGILGTRYPSESYPLDLALMVGNHWTDEFTAQNAGIRYQWAEQWRAGW